LFKTGGARADDPRQEVRAMDDTIREILAEHARLSVEASELKDDTDLYQVGLSSHGTVNVMLALEDAFDVEVPDDLMRKSTFQSIAAIRSMIESLTSVADRS
jgi:acyl carrier protein